MRLTDQQANRLRVLKSIRRGEPISRTEVAARTGLTNQAISDIVADLIDRSLLLEDKAPAQGRGRPRTLLRINPDAARVIGAFLFPDHALGVEVADLRGDTLFATRHQLPITQTADELASPIAAAMGRTLVDAAIPKTMIHSVGLGVPGLVDSLAGVLHWTPRYPWGPVPLAQLISDQLDLPVFLDSAADVVTRAEHWHGAERQVDDFALIFLGFGLGLGRYVDGVLRTGDHGMSPALAHLKVTPGQGPACICGAQGCLTTYASVSGIVAQIAAVRGQAWPPLERMREALHVYAAEARAGAVDARRVFDFAALALGVTAANYINVNDPARLLLLVQDSVFMAIIAEPFRAALEANTHPALRGRTPVDIRASEEVAFAKGTAALVLEQLYRGGSASPAG